jgi:hypothetical protein
VKVEGGAGEAGEAGGEELITHAQCPMPNAPCPMPNAPCPMPHDYLVSIVQIPSQDSGGGACW